MTHPYLDPPAAVTDALEGLAERVRRVVSERGADVEAVEAELVSMFAEAGRAVMTVVLERLDPVGDDVVIDGRRYWRAVDGRRQYMSLFGRISVERGLFRSERNGPTLCPVELRACVVESFWTPRAAKLAALSASDMTPYRAEGFFVELGMMKPSRSSLDRLPKSLNRIWETNRERNEACLRAMELVPQDAVTVAVSLDGVMVPLRGTQKATMKEEMRSQGRPDRGPAGYREVGCGALSFYDADGNRLATRRLGRMPEAHKRTLKEQLRAELEHVLQQRPDLTTVAVADGSIDNWTFLDELNPDFSVLDYYHAADHLKRALDVAMGPTSIKTQLKFKKLRTTLKDGRNGVATVIRSLAQLLRKRTGTRRDYIGISYFKRHKHRMKYDDLAKRNLPIGSGVIEGTCKSLAADRLKRAGMRWAMHGGQAVLNLRAWSQSARFDNAWRLLRDNYEREVADFATAA